MTKSTTSFISVATTSPPISIEPPAPRPFRPGPRSPAWPLRRSRQGALPGLHVSLQPQPHNLTVPRADAGLKTAEALVGFRGDGAHHLTMAAIRAPSRA